MQAALNSDQTAEKRVGFETLLKCGGVCVKAEDATGNLKRMDAVSRIRFAMGAVVIETDLESRGFIPVGESLFESIGMHALADRLYIAGKDATVTRQSASGAVTRR